MPLSPFTQSPLRALISNAPTPEDDAAQQAAELANTSQFQRGLAAGGYGMSAGSDAAEAQQAELAGQAQQASALRQQALEQATLAQTQGPTINSYTQVHGPLDALNYASGALGQAIPTMAPSLLGAALTRGRSPLAAYAGATAPAYLLERNEAILNQAQDPVQQAAPIEQRMAASRLKGGANALLEGLVPATLAHGFGHAGASALRTIGTSVLEEGATEGLQEKVGQLAQSAVNPNRDTSQDNQNIIDASLQGAIGGGGLSTPTALSQGVANRIADAGHATMDALGKTVELGKSGVNAAKQVIPDNMPEKTSDLMDRLFRVADGDTLAKLKSGVMDPALAKGKSLAETMQAMAQRRSELPQLAKDFMERAKDRYPGLAAKVDPNNPDSLLKAVTDIDWKNKLKVFTDNAKAGFEAGKAAGAKHNLMETLSPNDHADLQSILGSHLTPDAADVPSVREALPSIAARLAALSVRTGDLDRHDVESMTDLTDTMRSLFTDPQAVADKFAKHMKNAGPSVLSKLLSIESATSDVSNPNSFLQLSLSEKARNSNWDMRNVAKFVDRAVLDPDKANYSVLRNLFGSTAKANQVLDYYQGKMQESGVEVADTSSEESDAERRIAGINPLDLTEEEGPRYFFQNARAMTPFSATRRVADKEDGQNFETEHARRKLAQVIKQARDAGGDVSGLRARVVGYGEYAAQAGLDPAQRVAHFTKLASKRREAALKKGKKLLAEGASEESLAQERRKVMQANRELKFLKTDAAPEDVLNHLYQVVRVDRAQNNTEMFGSDQVYRMGQITRSRPKDAARRAANDATKVSLTDPSGGRVELSAEGIAREALRVPDRVQNNETSLPQKYQQAFADGMAGLLSQGYKLTEGQNLNDVVVHRASGVKALVESMPAPIKKRFGPPSDAVLDRVESAKQYAAKFKDKPFQLFENMAEHYTALKNKAVGAKGPHAAVLKSRLRVTREQADSGLRRAMPMPEAAELSGSTEEQQQDAAMERLKQLEQLHDELIELTDHYPAKLIKGYLRDVEHEIDRLSEEETARKYEEDTGLPVGQEKGRGRAAVSGDKLGVNKAPAKTPAQKRAQYEADKALSKEAREANAKAGLTKTEKLTAKSPTLSGSSLVFDLLKQTTRDAPFGDVVKNALDIIEQASKDGAMPEAMRSMVDDMGKLLLDDKRYQALLKAIPDMHSIAGSLQVAIAAHFAKGKASKLYKGVVEDRANAVLAANDEALANRALGNDSSMDPSHVRSMSREKYDQIRDALISAKPETIGELIKTLLPHANAQQTKMLRSIGKLSWLQGNRAQVLDFRHSGQFGMAAGVHNPQSFPVGMGHMILPPTSVSLMLTSAGDKNMDPIATAIHELGHAATQQIETASPQARRDIQRMLAHARKQLATYYNVDKIYGLGDAQEFIAESWSNPTFQKMLEGIPAINTQSFKNLWEEFKAFIGKILGVTDNPSLLDEALTVSFGLARDMEQIRSGVDASLKGKFTGALEKIKSVGLLGNVDVEKLNSQTGGAQGNTLSPEEQNQLIADLQRQRGPDLKVIFEDFHKVGGSGSYTYDAQTGERTIRVALQAINPSLVGWHEALHDFFQMLGGDKSSTKMRKEFTAIVNSQPVIRQLRALLKDHPAALEQIETDAEERAAYAYQFFLAGQLRVGPDTKTLFGRIHAFLAKILHTVSTGARVEQYLAALYQGHLADPSIASQVLAAIQANSPTYADRMQALSDVLGNVPEKIFGSTIERLDNTNVRALSDVGEAFYLPPDKQQEKMLPFLPRRSMAKGVWTNKFFKIMEQYSHDELKQALTQLQSHDRTGPIGSQIAKVLDEMFDYQKTAGVKDLVRVKDADGNFVTKEVDVKPVKNYFPRVWDLDTIRKNLQGFADVLMQHGGLNGEQAMRIALDMATLQGLGKSEIDKQDVNYVPFNQSTLEREFDFINDTNAHAFAPFQSQDLAEIVTTYADQAVHRAEWARQFGNQGQWLEDKLEEAKQQGATADDITMARAAIKGMEGTLGLDMNPKWRKLQAGIITAENLILLPLALFSQVVDAVAIGARSNSYKESLHALDRGFREVVKSFTKNANTFSKDDRLAMDLGIIDETAMLEAMGMTYQGMYMSKRLRNINRKFFRLNRFEQWNRAMRVQGMVTGQRFILANKNNARYMDELGLSAQDVIETPDGQLATTELDGLTASQARKIRTALHKFTDTAVLRPNAAHRPIWGNDPRYMLLMHLKQFSFTYQNVILKNMKKELAFGNAKPALVLLGAVPLIMMSNLMKSAMTGNLDSGLTFSQALIQGIERSGLMGTRQFYTDAYNDMANGSMPGTSFLGPSFEHALTIVDGLVGTKTPGDVLVRSIPGGAILKNLTN